MDDLSLTERRDKMEKFSSPDEVLDVAISMEMLSYQLYTDLAERMKRPEICRVLLDFAREELIHKEKLDQLKANTTEWSFEDFSNIDITEFVSDVDSLEDMNYKEAVFMAMNKENAAWMFYKKLAASAVSENLRNIFAFLAGQEEQHKQYFEKVYNDIQLKQN